MQKTLLIDCVDLNMFKVNEEYQISIEWKSNRTLYIGTVSIVIKIYYIEYFVEK